MTKIRPGDMVEYRVSSSGVRPADRNLRDMSYANGVEELWRPALVTHVWEGQEPPLLNVRAISNSSGHGDVLRTSVPHVSKSPDGPDFAWRERE